MGSLTPILGTLTQTMGAVSTFANSVDTLSGGSRRDISRQQNLAMQNLQQSQVLALQQAQQKAEQDRTNVATQSQQDEARRRKALKRSIAKQNARVGASGLSKMGSNEAVLLGLVNDDDDDRQNAKQLDQLRYNAIDNNLINLQQNNILQQSQLADRQRLDRAISNF